MRLHRGPDAFAVPEHRHGGRVGVHAGERVECLGRRGGFGLIGGVAAGMTFYLKDGVPIFDYNYFEDHAIIKGDTPLPDGESKIELAFDYAGGGQGKGGKVAINVNGERVAEGDIPATVAARFGVDTFDIGQDSGQPVTFEVHVIGVL